MPARRAARSTRAAPEPRRHSPRPSVVGPPHHRRQQVPLIAPQRPRAHVRLAQVGDEQQGLDHARALHGPVEVAPPQPPVGPHREGDRPRPRVRVGVGVTEAGRPRRGEQGGGGERGEHGRKRPTAGRCTSGSGELPRRLPAQLERERLRQRRLRAGAGGDMDHEPQPRLRPALELARPAVVGLSPASSSRPSSAFGGRRPRSSCAAPAARGCDRRRGRSPRRRSPSASGCGSRARCAGSFWATRRPAVVAGWRARSPAPPGRCSRSPAGCRSRRCRADRRSRGRRRHRSRRCPPRCREPGSGPAARARQRCALVVAREAVAAGPTVEEVTAGRALDRVVAGAAADDVVAGAAA